MTAMTVLYSLALVGYVALLVRILSRRPLTSLHWSCAVVLASLAVWSIEDVVHGIPAAPAGLVRLFADIGSIGWGRFASANLYFTLLLTHREATLRSWLLRGLLVAVPLATVVAQCTGMLIHDHAQSPTGWHSIWSNSGWPWAYRAYYMTFTLAAFYLLLRFRLTTRRYRERRQAEWILATGLTVLVLGSLTDVVLPELLGIRTLELAGALGLLWAGGLYIAVTRYGLMSVTPQAAADDILRTMGDALLLVTPEGTIATANHTSRSLFRCRIRDLRGQPAEQLFAQPAAFADALARVNRHGTLANEEPDCLTRDGRRVPVSVSSRLMRDRDGEPVGSVWVLRDITLKRMADERQAQMTKEIAAANQELTDFAHVVSHDLKAPLRAIESLARWLMDDYQDKLDEKRREQLALLVGRVDRMRRLIDGILQYSRAGRLRSKPTEVNLAELLPALIESLAPPSHIRVTVEGTLPIVFGERIRLEQVFQNLISNAIKYCDKPQGEVRIGCIEVPGEDCWRFYVADNGPGIDENDFDRVFQLFQTLRPRDGADSTGVGLAVVKKIVEASGGRVWLKSRVNYGTTFFFTYPKLGS